MILVISYPDEDHTIEVIRHLKASGREVRLLSLSDFPARAGIELSWGPSNSPVYMVNNPEGRLDLSAARVIWWRRVVQFDIDPNISRPNDRLFSESETSQAIHGVLDSLDCRWVNPRAADDSAHRKPFQWEVAHRLGIELPRTLVTNEPNVARCFIEQIGLKKTVFKAFLASTEDWRETRLVEATDLPRLDSVRYAPVIFQEYIEGVDLRITVVGDRLYTAEIDVRRTSYPCDMRMVIGEADIKPTDLPPAVRDSILRLMRELGLVYGAIDMRRTVDGRFIFLEVNPAGQWLFVEQRTGMPISKAMADFLAACHDSHTKGVSDERDFRGYNPSS
jgi:glutathione synthase/RimK-type ligase-like ATP-grasp enzyme